jgi:hypothetical protein
MRALIAFESREIYGLQDLHAGKRRIKVRNMTTTETLTRNLWHSRAEESAENIQNSHLFIL